MRRVVQLAAGNSATDHGNSKQSMLRAREEVPRDPMPVAPPVRQQKLRIAVVSLAIVILGLAGSGLYLLNHRAPVAGSDIHSIAVLPLRQSGAGVPCRRHDRRAHHASGQARLPESDLTYLGDAIQTRTPPSFPRSHVHSRWTRSWRVRLHFPATRCE